MESTRPSLRAAPLGVSFASEAIAAAFENTPRHPFIAEHLRMRSYLDESLPEAQGRYGMTPSALCTMLEAGGARAGLNALVIAPGLGYPAAICASLGMSVAAVEPDAMLRADAEAACGALDLSVEFSAELPAARRAAKKRCDLMLICGSLSALPTKPARYCRPGARVLFGLRHANGVTLIRLEVGARGQLLREELVDLHLPPLTTIAGL